MTKITRSTNISELDILMDQMYRRWRETFFPDVSYNPRPYEGNKTPGYMIIRPKFLGWDGWGPDKPYFEFTINPGTIGDMGIVVSTLKNQFEQEYGILINIVERR